MPVPASEDVLVLFVSQLAKDGLKHRTIKAYLSAIRFLHIAEGRGDPFLSTEQAPLHHKRGEAGGSQPG